MTEPDSYSFERYLEAKRTVDARALNRSVREALRRRLADTAPGLQVLEIGAGTGAAVERAFEWPAGGHVRYTAVEQDPDLVDTAVGNVVDCAGRHGLACERSARTVRVDGADGRREAEPGWEALTVEFLAEDAFAVLDRADGEWDLVVGQAFMDLTDVAAALEAVLGALRPGGTAYFPITFDGTTAFVPAVDPDLDARIERRYHRHMDSTEKAGGHTGDSRAGRHLLGAVPAAGGSVLAAGGSDWVVRPTGDGYVGDEAYVLHHIVETVRAALDDGGAPGSDRVAEWARRRHEQAAAADLTYLTHQLDVLAGAPER